jgi:hypothetical protein
MSSFHNDLQRFVTPRDYVLATEPWLLDLWADADHELNEMRERARRLALQNGFLPDTETQRYRLTFPAFLLELAMPPA